MPIDGSVIQRAQAAAGGFNSPFKNLDAMLGIQQAQQNQEINAAKLADAQRKAQQQAALQQTIQKHGGDWEAALPEIRAIAPDLSLDIEKQIGEARQQRLTAFKTELGVQSDLTARYLARLRAVPEGDEEMYQFVRGQMAKDLPEEAAMLPEAYDRAALAQFAQLGLSAKEAYDQQQKGLDRILEGKWREGAGTVLSTAADQEDWDEMVAGFRKNGMPESELAQFGSFSPENVQRAGQLAMSPKERADQANQAAAREIQRIGQQVTMRGQDMTAASAAAGRAVTMRGQNLTDARAKADASGGGAGGKSQAELIEAVMANPAIYADLTPTIKAAIAGELSKRGFKFSQAATKGGPNVTAIMGEIEGLSKKINTGGAGPLTTVTGWMRKGAAGANLDNDVAEYEALIKGMIPMVARANGHTGVLTQQDVDSTRNLFPQVGDNQTLAQNKLARVNLLINGGAPPPKDEAKAGERRAIPGIPGGEAELRNGRWIRVK